MGIFVGCFLVMKITPYNTDPYQRPCRLNCPQVLISVGEPTFIGETHFSCAGKYKQRHLNGPHEFVCGTYPAPDGGGQNLSPHPEGSDLSQQNTNRNCEEKLWLLEKGLSLKHRRSILHCRVIWVFMNHFKICIIGPD